MRLRIALAALPLVFVVWVALGAYLGEMHRTEIHDAQQESRNLSRAFEENIRRTVEAIDTTIRALRVARAHDPTHFDLSAWERDSGLTRELTLQLSLATRSGDILTTNLVPTAGRPASIADRDHFRVPRDTEGDHLFISRPLIGRVSGRWSVQFVRKLFDADGAFDGVVVASLDPTFLSRFYTSLDIGRGAMLLLGQDGIVRSAGPESVVRLGEDLLRTPLGRAASADTQGTLPSAGTPDRIERIYSWRRVDPYGLIVAAGLSVEDALTGFRHALKGCVAVGVGLTAIVLLVNTALARSRRDLLRSREILQAAVTNISQGLIVVDRDRRVPLLNERAVELLDLPAHLAVAGFEFDALLEWQLASGEFAGQDAAAVRTLVESGGIDRGSNVYRRTRQNGTTLEVRTKVLDTGLAVRTFTDVTEQERTAHILAHARDAAEAAMRARSEFLAVMSHEIRTPLNGVIGVAGLLEGMELGTRQRDYVHLIRQSGDHLLELVNDILDFSRLDAQRVELEEVDFDPRALIQTVIGMFLSQAAAKGLHLAAVADASVGPALKGDPGRLRQVLLNLVGNAVKFTEQGSIRLTLAQEPAAEGSIRLCGSVADTGVGMVPEAADRIFQEFTQIDGSISRRFGGSGLGLAICRRLIELMGGGITVETQPGQGSTFRFDVLLKPGDAALPPVELAQDNPAPVVARRILLAEDNPTNRLVAVQLLERLGHQTHSAGNGLETIAAWESGRYDLILMDVMMPEMDGLTATRHIRAAEAGRSHIAIVGLTAGSGADTRAACLEAGMDAVTTKPVTLARLQQAIADGLGATVQKPARADRETTPRLRELAEILGDDAVAEIVRTFAEDAQANLESMKQAAACNDANMIRRAAHSVAGAARNVGADALAKRASALEETLASVTTAQVAAEIAAMQADLAATLERLGIAAAKV
jgi:signal transduction histidine kinase/DNA-binding NarL/FixJ family response regulator